MPRPRIPEATRAAILARAATGEKQETIAADLGVSRTLVSNIARPVLGHRRRGPRGPSPERQDAIRADRAAGLSWQAISRRHHVAARTARDVCARPAAAATPQAEVAGPCCGDRAASGSVGGAA